MILRSPVLRFSLAALLLCLPRLAQSQEAGIPPKLHPWGLFDPGAWKTVRVITESINDRGDVIGTNITDTTTTLMDIDATGVTLEVLACMEVAGKRFEAEPQTIKQGFHGELATPTLKLDEPADGTVVIGGQKIACKVQRLTSSSASGRMSATIYYSKTVPPYLLRRESATIDADGKSVSETKVDVTALDTPMESRRETKSGVKIRTVYRNGNSTVTTLAEVLPDVPGGVVNSNSSEVDGTGRLVRRSTLKLVDYGSEPQKERPFRKRAAARRAKQASRQVP